MSGGDPALSPTPGEGLCFCFCLGIKGTIWPRKSAINEALIKETQLPSPVLDKLS